MRIYSKRRIAGFYKDELGRTRPITEKVVIIELPPTIFMEKAEEKKEKPKPLRQATLEEFEEVIENAE